MSKGIKFDKDAMDLIKLFDAITGANTLDCVILPDGDGTDRIYFLVDRVNISKAVGKNGVNVKKLKEKLMKNIDIVAYSEDINTFLRYLLYPAKIIKTEEKTSADGRKLIIIDVRPEDKGIAIGKNGRTILKANTFIKRHFEVDSVIINTKS